MPSVKKTASKVDDAIKQNTVMDGQVKANKETVLKQRTELDAAILEGQKLKEKLAKECHSKDIDISKLNAALIRARELNTALEKENKDLTNTVALTAGLLEEARTTVKQLIQEVQALESTELSLRFQLEGANKNLGEKDKYIESLENDKDGLIKKAASSGVYKNWVIGLASFIGIAGIAFVALRSYRII